MLVLLSTCLYIGTAVCLSCYLSAGQARVRDVAASARLDQHVQLMHKWIDDEKVTLAHIQRTYCLNCLGWVAAEELRVYMEC